MSEWRRRHLPVERLTDPTSGHEYCPACRQEWPCDAEREKRRADAAQQDADRLAETGDHDRECDLMLRPQAATAYCSCGWSDALQRHEALAVLESP